MTLSTSDGKGFLFITYFVYHGFPQKSVMSIIIIIPQIETNFTEDLIFPSVIQWTISIIIRIVLTANFDKMQFYNHLRF